MRENKWRELFGAEWDYVVRLGAALHEPEAKRAFWDTVREKKLADPKYSIYDDFPRSEGITARARDECCQFVKSLRGGKRDEGETA